MRPSWRSSPDLQLWPVPPGLGNLADGDLAERDGNVGDLPMISLSKIVIYHELPMKHGECPSKQGVLPIRNDETCQFLGVSI